MGDYRQQQELEEQEQWEMSNMQKSESIKDLATALAAAQLELENASKGSTNPQFKSKYADLAEVLNTVRPVLAKHGLSVAQFPSLQGNIAHVETLLMHSSGEWLSNVASAPLTKQDAQGVGSVTTYLRRYSLAALAGIGQEDDDANAVSGSNASKVDLEANALQAAAMTLTKADSLEALKAAWQRIAPALRDKLEAVKNTRKQELEAK